MKETNRNFSTESMRTVAEVLNELKQKGYTKDFNLLVKTFNKQNLQIRPSFHIDRAYRFEGDTNPSDEAVVYAISSDDDQFKGVLVNSYGVYSDPFIAEFARALWKVNY